MSVYSLYDSVCNFSFAWKLRCFFKLPSLILKASDFCWGYERKNWGKPDMKNRIAKDAHCYRNMWAIAEIQLGNGTLYKAFALDRGDTKWYLWSAASKVDTDADVDARASYDRISRLWWNWKIPLSASFRFNLIWSASWETRPECDLNP